MDLTAEIIARIESRVSALAGRVAPAADLQRLIAANALPQAAIACFVVPAGIRAVDSGKIGSGFFIQRVDDVYALVTVIRNAGSVTGGNKVATIGETQWALIEALSGWGPEDAPGVFTLTSAQTLSSADGAFIHQAEFSIRQDVRIVA